MSLPHAGITPLGEAAAAAHEMYEALRAAGFTEEQAMWLVLGLIKAAQAEGGRSHGE